jgi:hypothetical protein
MKCGESEKPRLGSFLFENGIGSNWCSMIDNRQVDVCISWDFGQYLVDTMLHSYRLAVWS